MYLRFMTKHRPIILIIQIVIICMLSILHSFKYEYLLMGLASIGLFGGAYFIVIRFVYRGGVSLKINLMLIMWDLLFIAAMAFSFVPRHRSVALPLLFIFLPIGNMIAILAKKFDVH